MPYCALLWSHIALEMTKFLLFIYLAVYELSI